MRCTKIATEYQHQIDRQAEAIGEAEDNFYAELLEQEPPTTRLKIEQDYRVAAIARGLSLATPRYPYAKMASINAWDKICRRFAAGNVSQPAKRYPSQSKFYPRKHRDAAFHADVESRRPAPGAKPINVRHLARIELYRERLRSGQLAVLNAEALLTVPAAAKLSGIPSRTVFNVVSRGELKTVPCLNGIGKEEHLITAGELRRWVQSLILPTPPQAA